VVFAVTFVTLETVSEVVFELSFVIAAVVVFDGAFVSAVVVVFDSDLSSGSV
jgi:hypothetical protein